ncbi:ATP-binding protein [Mangrovicoccus sp. HB161399]|uniref:ATP-binding protein n=1 Tax=Mangrovicoccus sp. HB161399 TaxID=2720392 RepID=UPI0015562998|nr:ATP-binding protein [Mangrovicoccus sp. HB161399]
MMETVHPPAADETGFAGDYAAALAAHAAQGDETGLTAAFQLARAGMALGVSLTEICEIHQGAAAAIAAPETAQCSEEFLLEALTVYDMALRGHLDTIRQLRQEVEERQRIEEDLRLATFALSRQRDNLETEVEKRTQQVVAMLDDLHRTNKELMQNNQEQAEFAYAVSHDLKSPTNTVRMLLNALVEDYGAGMPEGARELVAMQSATVERMLRLIDDLLSYSNTVDAELVLAPVPLDRLLASVAADLFAEIEEGGAEVVLGALPEVRGDETQLRILFQNLVANAIKFRDPGRPQKVEISCADPAADPAVITVRDRGIGIPPGQGERIFGLFQRLHAHDDYPGSGLGLAICKRIATKHDGAIGVEPGEGEGTVFRVTLPRHAEGPEP